MSVPAASRKLPYFPSPVTPNLHQMATFIKRGETWRAQIRRKGHKSVTATFPTKAQAQAWARKIEAEMDGRRFMDARGLANITLKELIDWYSEEIGGEHPLGKNKKAVLRIWVRDHGGGMPV